MSPAASKTNTRQTASVMTANGCENRASFFAPSPNRTCASARWRKSGSANQPAGRQAQGLFFYRCSKIVLENHQRGIQRVSVNTLGQLPVWLCPLRDLGRSEGFLSLSLSALPQNHGYRPRKQYHFETRCCQMAFRRRTPREFQSAGRQTLSHRILFELRKPASAHCARPEPRSHSGRIAGRIARNRSDGQDFLGVASRLVLRRQ